MNVGQMIGLVLGAIAVVIPLLAPKWSHQIALQSSHSEPVLVVKILIFSYMIGMVTGTSTVVNATLRGFGVHDSFEISGILGIFIAIGIGKWHKRYLRKNWDAYVERTSLEPSPAPEPNRLPDASSPQGAGAETPAKTISDSHEAEAAVTQKKLDTEQEQAEGKAHAFKGLRFLHVPALEQADDSFTLEALGTNEVLAHHRSYADWWESIADAYQNQVGTIAENVLLIGHPQPLDQCIALKSLQGNPRFCVVYEGNDHGGNANILVASSDDQTASPIGIVKVDKSPNGLRCAFFLIWGARSRGAVWHGLYNVPLGFIFEEPMLINTLAVREGRNPVDVDLADVLCMPTGFRFSRREMNFRISCLGYRTNVGICDYWVDISGNGLILNCGEIVVLKTKVRTFY